ncbi:EscU/YscU/HrcU family type III secretion system export apparatus switch protein [Trinickia diaoshuihuensis]|uniref:EscU/YscU/HrcU family type III secretion system export apparatus switch protein n=1 Tax=Trinickia diaoshuihuensis TaxID=2292265 RepID=UPI000E24E55D|nr:EscU/YscU/HrcU family type III secretion system export apparatus switch protein [Trinickia diaoshuihuensis]
MSDKPLPPTDKRVRDAAAEGNVARSDVWAGFVGCLLATEAAFAMIDAGIDRWLALQAAVFSALAEAEADPLQVGLRLLPDCLGAIVVTIGLFAAIALAAAVLAAWASSGLSFAPKAIRPSFKRLNAARHFKGLFGAKNLTALVIALACACLVGGLAYGLLRARLPLVGAMIDWQSIEFDLRAGTAALHIFVRALLAAFFVPAALSLLVAKRQHHRALRMTHREVKDELKQTSGDPSMRARQRASFTEAVFAAAPNASRRNGRRALVTNPEHVAVLLDYRGDDADVPTITAKATDDDAIRLTNEALLERVTVFRFRKLARRLYRCADLQATIPDDCYRAVAIVFRIVDELEALSDRPNTPIEIDDVAFDSE